ncbi:MAG: nickel pincer cofactor biosynthesis protein LarB [Thermoanaerobaculia bacterium]
MPTSEFTLDFDRQRRLGFPEVVLASGKLTSQISAICRQLAREHDVLVTRLGLEQWEEVSREPLPGHAEYDERSRTLILRVGKPNRQISGEVSIVTAGTADIRVAEEARRTLDYMGVRSRIIADVGVAGVVRLLSNLEEIEKADIVIAVAGMEGAIFSVVGGLVGRPIICVPTSVGYGANFEGLASLLSALNSCANGVTAVNIDSGYGAAMAAYRILSKGPKTWQNPSESAASAKRPRSTSTARRSASTGARRRRS